MTQNAERAPEIPETFEIIDEATLARANEVLDWLATGVFPDGDFSPELLTWSERLLSQDSAASPQLSIEERLKAAEARFLTLVEQIPAVTFMAVLGEGENDVYVSPHIEHMLGYSQEEWLSNPFLWYYRLHPEDRAIWNAEFTRGIRTGGPFRAECRFMARDGRTVWVHGEARLVRDDIGRPQFLQGVAFDITESKRAQEIMMKTAVEKAKHDEEMEIARRMQTSILPRNPSLPNLEISATMIPADDVGGDYYDVRPTLDGGGLITIGDVSGHGLNAGLVMLMMQSAAHAIAVAREFTSPSELLSLLNRVMYDNVATRLQRDEYVTLCVLRYSQNGDVIFAGAHQDILLLRAQTRRVERVGTVGPWVGVREHIRAIALDSVIRLHNGDTLILFTDGIIEAMNEAGDLFDLPRLCDAIEQMQDGTPEQIRDHVIAKVREFTTKQDDDMTLLVARYKHK
jgi:PAS domain S-box-containing protein